MLRGCPRNCKHFLAFMCNTGKKNVCRLVSFFWLCRRCVALESCRFLCRIVSPGCVGLCRLWLAGLKARQRAIVNDCGPSGWMVRPSRRGVCRDGESGPGAFRISLDYEKPVFWKVSNPGRRLRNDLNGVCCHQSGRKPDCSIKFNSVQTAGTARAAPQRVFESGRIFIL